MKRKLNLVADKVLNEYQKLSGFEIDYIYVRDDSLAVHLKPSSAGVINIYLNGEGPENPGPTDIVVSSTVATRISNFIQAIEDGIKTKLEA